MNHIVIGLCLLMMGNPALSAAEELNPVTFKEQITEVMAAPEFSTTRDDHEYRFTGDGWWPGFDDDDEDPISTDDDGLSWIELAVTILSRFTEALLWSLVVAALVLLFVYRDRWLPLLSLPGSGAQKKKVAQVVVGLDIRPESLPEDIPHTVLTLWRAGDRRSAISLLYRGALSVLVVRYGFELPASATEYDCVETISAASEADLTAFFDELTRTWLAMAYAELAPDDTQVGGLCDQWRQHFEALT